MRGSIQRPLARLRKLTRIVSTFSFPDSGFSTRIPPSRRSTMAGLNATLDVSYAGHGPLRLGPRAPQDRVSLPLGLERVQAQCPSIERAGLESLGKRRKEFASGEGPLWAELAGASESLGGRRPYDGLGLRNTRFGEALNLDVLHSSFCLLHSARRGEELLSHLAEILPLRLDRGEGRGEVSATHHRTSHFGIRTCPGVSKAGISCIELLNRSSRREEVLISFCPGSLSLLTSAATNGGIMGKGRGGYLARKPCSTALSQAGSDTVILPRKNAQTAKGNSALSLQPSAFSPQPSHGLLHWNCPAHGGEQMTGES